MDVDPAFGTLADADALIARAHAFGLRVIFDWVPNHTSDRHPWFQASRSSTDDARRSWYVWRDPAPGGGPPNNWTSTFSRDGARAAWTLDEGSGQYWLHSFLPEQPDLNWDEPAVAEAMHGVLRFWLDRGVDGFRMDVVHKIGKDPDCATTSRAAATTRTGRACTGGCARFVGCSTHTTATGWVWRGLRARPARARALRRRWRRAPSGPQLRLSEPSLVGGGLPRHRRPVRGAGGAKGMAGMVPWQPRPSSDRHPLRPRARPGRGHAAADPSRHALPLSGRRARAAGREVPPDRVVDVDGRDPVRSPIPWDPPSAAGPGAGFTAGDPWLPITPDAEHLAASVQSEDPGSMLSLHRSLLALRAAPRRAHRGRLPPARRRRRRVRVRPGRAIAVALNFAPEPRRQPPAATAGCCSQRARPRRGA